MADIRGLACSLRLSPQRAKIYGNIAVMPERPPEYMLSALNALRRGDPATARLEAEAVLAARPGDRLVAHLLGVACCHLGDFRNGISHLQMVLAAEPENLAVRRMLARALCDSGNSRGLYDITEGRNEPELLELRASAAHALELWSEEASALAMLCELRPADLQLRRAFGHALALAGELQRASEALDEALILDPQSVETRVELGQLLCDLGEAESGLAAFDDGLVASPSEQSLLLGRARALTLLRRFDEAELTYLKQLDFAPANVGAVREYGLLLERTGRIEQLPSLIERARKAGIAGEDLGLLEAFVAFQASDHDRARALAEVAIPIDPVRVHRLIAKIEESRRDLVAALAASEAMNASVPDLDHWRRRGAAARAEIRRLGEVTTPDWAARFPRDRPGVRTPPAFIVGFPRSGTTLLDTFLMGHPDVTVLEEEPMLEAAKAVVGDLAKLPEANEELIAAARRAYFASLDERTGAAPGRLVVDKMPFNMLGAALLHRLFPGAPIVFVQRHPCDVVLSGFMQSFRLNDGMASFLDLGDSADLYDAAMDLWTRTRAALPLQVHDLVYEDLVEDPAKVLGPLVAFLGLDWREELLDHQATAARRGTIITPSYDQVTKPISRAAKGRWRRLTDQMAPVLPVLLPWAGRLGYEEGVAS